MLSYIFQSNNICRFILYCIPMFEMLLFHHELRHVTQNRELSADDNMENWLSRWFDILTFAIVAFSTFELNYIKLYQLLFYEKRRVYIFLLIALLIALLTALVRIPEFKDKNQARGLRARIGLWMGECVKFNFLCWIILAAITLIIAELYSGPSSINAFLNEELDPDYTAFLLYSVACVPFFYYLDIWERRITGHSKEVEKYKNKNSYTPALWEHMNSAWLVFFTLFFVIDLMLLFSTEPAVFSHPYYALLIASISIFFISFAFFDQQNQHIEKSLLAYLGKHIPACQKKLKKYEDELTEELPMINADKDYTPPNGREGKQESNLSKKTIFLILLGIELGYLLIFPIRILGLTFDLGLCLPIIAVSVVLCCFTLRLEKGYQKVHPDYYKSRESKPKDEKKELEDGENDSEDSEGTTRSIEFAEFLVPAAVILFWIIYRNVFKYILK